MDIVSLELGPEPLGPPGMTVEWTVSEVSVSQGVELEAGADQAGVEETTGVEAPSEGSTGDSPVGVGLAGTETVWDPEWPGITVEWTMSEVSVSQGVEDSTGDSPVGVGLTGTVTEAELE